MSADSERLPPPNEPGAFESLCLDLWRDLWRDPSAQKNGRSGQSQCGVDVLGRPKGKWIGVQCKQKDGLLGSKLTVKELEREVGKALTFEPKLTAFILATTGPADAKVQQRARELTEKHHAKGLFAVDVWSWERIWHELFGRENLLRKTGPLYWPRIWALFSKLQETKKQMSEAGGAALQKTQSPLGIRTDWTMEGPCISNDNVDISPTESCALLERWSDHLPKRIDIEVKKRGKSYHALLAANVSAAFLACSNTYCYEPNETELLEMRTELSRKYDLFYKFTLFILSKAGNNKRSARPRRAA